MKMKRIGSIIWMLTVVMTLSAQQAGNRKLSAWVRDVKPTPDPSRRDGRLVSGEGVVYAFFDFSQLVAPVSTNLLGMEAEHGVAEAGILSAGVQHSMAGCQVDGGQEDSGTASIAGSLYDSVAVGVELFAVEVAVGVDVIHITCCGEASRPCRRRGVLCGLQELVPATGSCGLG